MRLLERLQQDTLVLVAEPADVGHHRDPARAEGRLQVEERLQGKLVKLGRFVGQEPDLIDRKWLDPVVLPVVGISLQRSLWKQG